MTRCSRATCCRTLSQAAWEAWWRRPVFTATDVCSVWALVGKLRTVVKAIGDDQNGVVRHVSSVLKHARPARNLRRRGSGSTTQAHRYWTFCDSLAAYRKRVFPRSLVKKGVVVVSGTGPAIRVDCGHVGGFITFDALRWLRDTGVIFHPTRLGCNPNAPGPRCPDRSALRRTQALVCSGAYRRRPWPSLARSCRPNSAAGCGRGAHRIGGCEHEDRQARCEGRA